MNIAYDCGENINHCFIRVSKEDQLVGTAEIKRGLGMTILIAKDRKGNNLAGYCQYSKLLEEEKKYAEDIIITNYNKHQGGLNETKSM
ncbi:hypothetical protein KAT80_01930 [Candidatus Pacearchaeota archaeon]|nr:hypothetical protein [Candidatus Pacearchaeota archaeon]